MCHDNSLIGGGGLSEDHYKGIQEYLLPYRFNKNCFLIYDTHNNICIPTYDYKIKVIQIKMFTKLFCTLINVKSRLAMA